MCHHRSVYRGYAITLSGAHAKWSFRVERIAADLPMLSRPLSDGHVSCGTALRTPSDKLTDFFPNNN